MASRYLMICRYVMMILLALIFALPILFMIASSLKPYWQFLEDLSSWRAFLPIGRISLENYIDAFNFVPLGKFLYNSLLITGITVGSGLIVNSLAGFALSRLKWKGRQLILAVIIATYIIPFVRLRSLFY